LKLKTFYHNVFIGNNYNVAFDENVKLIGNSWNNGKEGNYWDHYNGTDGNRDGIGDTLYVINGENIANYPLMEPYDIEGDVVVLPPPDPFPATLVAVASGVSVTVIGVSLLVYFRKRSEK